MSGDLIKGVQVFIEGLLCFLRRNASDGGCGGRPGRCQRDLAQIGLNGRMHRLRELVDDIGHFMDPSALMAGVREDIVERLPEPHGAIAHDDFRRDWSA